MSEPTTAGPDEPEGHQGPVVLVLPDGAEQAARAHLVARFDPLAGTTVWVGRVDRRLPVRTVVVVRTPNGEGRAETTEHDVWGNTRVRGLDRPPFPVELLDATGH
ncbi:DUF4873 domain-containing protein [Modestobacter versicolor]|uniref:DUF4873 domain-containing protein n=1 Tax=Modestobacter versicolor TaxID=429133 RepID=A0A323V765_9ACTN|nr:DUF4873 domain-containing protein [Modestobacter versicolor]MBB3675378.1 hypothetical protein [Modestobacter versicolor]PZA20717.1 DUF4873 domain-containing protein [Modestobacter versicolor]